MAVGCYDEDMSAQAHPRLKTEQYLELERAAEFRHEYYNGEMFLMSGGSHVHALVIANLSAALRNHLKRGPYRVTSSDLRVRISDRHYTYPDIAVVCGEPKYVDRQADTLTNPILVVESTVAVYRSLRSGTEGPRLPHHRDAQRIRA